MITKLGTRARAAPAQPAPEPVARLCYPTDKIKVAAFPIARSYAELSKEAAADNPYWVEGEPLYTIPSAQPAPKPPTEGDAHELWALAQLLPGEGIEDGVDRIVTFLARWGQGNG
jgi:hypothetical protein